MRTALLLLCAFALAIVPMSAPSADAHVCVQTPGGFPCSCPPDHERLHIHVNLNGEVCTHIPPIPPN